MPEALGGLGLGFHQLGLVVEQHGRFIAPGPFLATVTQFLPLVREAGDAGQQERFAGAAASGEIIGALAIDHGRAAEHALGDSLRARRDGARGCSMANTSSCSTATAPTRSRSPRASTRATAWACSRFRRAR